MLIHCDGGYTTNLSLADFLDDDVIFAPRHDGQDIDPDHGWPLRLVVPKLYAWKSDADSGRCAAIISGAIHGLRSGIVTKKNEE